MTGKEAYQSIFGETVLGRAFSDSLARAEYYNSLADLLEQRRDLSVSEVLALMAAGSK